MSDYSSSRSINLWAHFIYDKIPEQSLKMVNIAYWMEEALRLLAFDHCPWLTMVNQLRVQTTRVTWKRPKNLILATANFSHLSPLLHIEEDNYPTSTLSSNTFNVNGHNVHCKEEEEQETLNRGEMIGRSPINCHDKWADQVGFHCHLKAKQVEKWLGQG